MQPVDYRTEHISYYSLSIRKNIINTHDKAYRKVYSDLIEMLLNNYPVKPIVGKRTLNGEIIINSLVVAVLDDVMSHSEEYTKEQIARLESVKLELNHVPVLFPDEDLKYFYKY